MTRRSQSRWLLGACGLVALTIAGCGTGAKHTASLPAKDEHQLLGLIAAARTDAANRDAAGLHAALSQFAADVHSLSASGQLTQATARSLEQGALTTEQQAARELTATTTVQMVSTTTSTQPTTPVNGPHPPGHDGGPPPGHDHGPKPGPGDKPHPPKPDHGGHGGDGGDG